MTVSTRVRLLRHAPTAATRQHRFPADEALDADGRSFALCLAPVPTGSRLVTASSRRCRETAEAVAVPGIAMSVDSRWDELDFGSWVGATMDQVWDRDRDGMQRWLDDPNVPPPDGETFGSLVDRVADALASLRAAGGTTTVVTSAGPIKAAVLASLAAPARSAWHVDVAPGSVTVLDAGPGSGWILRGVNVPTTPATGPGLGWEAAYPEGVGG